jgi:uncharacterized protein (TIGR00730 family)
MHYTDKEKKLLSKILNSPTYRLAEEDKSFLKENEVRGVRLELDYLKAELVMQEHGIKHTIAVFGSARILPQEKAQRELETLLQKGAGKEDLAEAQKALQRSAYYEDARKLGSLIGGSGKSPQDNRVVVMTGGGPGIMEAANRGAFEAGANTIGLNIKLPHEQHPNPYVTPELAFLFHYFAIRKLHFFQRAKAMVIYPGGFGTMDELFELLTLIQTRTIDPMPVVLVGKSLWSRIFNFDLLVEEGMINQSDLEIFRVVDSAYDAWSEIIEWYKSRNNPLFPKGQSDNLTP